MYSILAAVVYAPKLAAETRGQYPRLPAQHAAMTPAARPAGQAGGSRAQVLRLVRAAAALAALVGHRA